MFSTEFFLTSLVVVLIPGTGVIYTVSTGLTLRWRASLAAAIGCTLGIVPHLLASIVGLSLLLHMSAQVFQGLKIAGTLYLLYLAWTMWRDTGSLSFDRTAQQTNGVHIAIKGILINILNPKLTLFFFAFLPLSVSPTSTSPTQQMIALSAAFMAMTFVVFALYGVLASGVSTKLMNSPKAIRRMQRSFALAFAVLAARLAVSER